MDHAQHVSSIASSNMIRCKERIRIALSEMNCRPQVVVNPMETDSLSDINTMFVCSISTIYANINEVLHA